jgi:hypothetical protein
MCGPEKKSTYIDFVGMYAIRPLEGGRSTIGHSSYCSVDLCQRADTYLQYLVYLRGLVTATRKTRILPDPEKDA